jgi:hypothetical protein
MLKIKIGVLLRVFAIQVPAPRREQGKSFAGTIS